MSWRQLPVTSDLFQHISPYKTLVQWKGLYRDTNFATNEYWQLGAIVGYEIVRYDCGFLDGHTGIQTKKVWRAPLLSGFPGWDKMWAKGDTGSLSAQDVSSSTLLWTTMLKILTNAPKFIMVWCFKEEDDAENIISDPAQHGGAAEMDVTFVLWGKLEH